MNKATTLLALSLAVMSAACSKDATRPVDDTDTTITPPPPPPPTGAVLVAAGNIARSTVSGTPVCSNNNSELTAGIIDTLGSSITVMTLGNAANPHGTATDYNGCFGATWGRFKDRIYPVIGNHDYDSVTNTAAEYFNYFGGRAGTPGEGWHSFNIGNDWHIVVLNTEGGTALYDAASAQQAWLQADLAANAGRKCTLAVYHRARFYSSSTPGGSQLSNLTSLWNKFAAGGVDVILNGGPYTYERMAPMSASGVRDDATGMRQFNAGMGGESSNSMPAGVHPNSEKLSVSFGVLRFTLKATGYDWQYITTANVVEDSGSGTCR